MAVEVANVPAKSLRNWMDRKLLSFMSEVEAGRDGESWRLFSVFDMMRLSITKSLVDFGVQVEFSSVLAMGAFAGDTNCYYLDKVSQDEFLKRLADRNIYVWRNGTGWEPHYSKDRPPGEVSAFLTVDVSALVRDVFDRLDAVAEGKA
ncbi:MAG TPA: hypothetical protein VIG36_04550 [Methylocystis sp.]